MDGSSWKLKFKDVYAVEKDLETRRDTVEIIERWYFLFVTLAEEILLNAVSGICS